MKTLVQKLTKLQRSVIAVGVMAVTAVSFIFMSFHPVVEAPAKEQTVEEQDGFWYQVEPHPSNPNLDVVTTTPAAPGNSASCSDENLGSRCSARLNAAISSSMTVEQIQNSSNLSINGEKFSEL